MKSMSHIMVVLLALSTSVSCGPEQSSEFGHDSAHQIEEGLPQPEDLTPERWHEILGISWAVITTSLKLALADMPFEIMVGAPFEALFIKQCNQYFEKRYGLGPIDEEIVQGTLKKNSRDQLDALLQWQEMDAALKEKLRAAFESQDAQAFETAMQEMQEYSARVHEVSQQVIDSAALLVDDASELSPRLKLAIGEIVEESTEGLVAHEGRWASVPKSAYADDLTGFSGHFKRLRGSIVPLMFGSVMIGLDMGLFQQSSLSNRRAGAPVPGTAKLWPYLTETDPRLRAMELCAHGSHTVAGGTAVAMGTGVVLAVQTFWRYFRTGNTNINFGFLGDGAPLPPCDGTAWVGEPYFAQFGYTVSSVFEDSWIPFGGTLLRVTNPKLNVEVTTVEYTPRPLPDGTISLQPTANEDGQLALQWAGPNPDGTGKYPMELSDLEAELTQPANRQRIWSSPALRDPVFLANYDRTSLQLQQMCSNEEIIAENESLNAHRTARQEGGSPDPLGLDFPAVCGHRASPLWVVEATDSPGDYDLIHHLVGAQPVRIRLDCGGIPGALLQ